MALLTSGFCDWSSACMPLTSPCLCSYGYLRLGVRKQVDNSPVTVDDTFVANFLEKYCETTPFEYEHVSEEVLDDKFSEFERAHGCAHGRYPLKSSMLRMLGHRLVRIPSRNVELLDEAEYKQNSNAAGWLLPATVHLIINILVFGLLPVPLAAVAFLYQREAQTLALAEDRFFTFDDFLLGPHSTAPSWQDGHVALQNTILLYSVLTFYVVLAIDLGLYMLEYLGIVASARQGGEHGWRGMSTFARFRYLLHMLFAGMAIFVCSAVLGYAGLVAVWASLAAIINPTRFLAYTTGVLSSITLLIARYQKIAASRRMLHQQVQPYDAL